MPEQCLNLACTRGQGCRVQNGARAGECGAQRGLGRLGEADGLAWERREAEAGAAEDAGEPKPLEINSVEDWVEARVQWEKDNTDLTAGVAHRERAGAHRQRQAPRRRLPAAGLRDAARRLCAARRALDEGI